MATFETVTGKRVRTQTKSPYVLVGEMVQVDGSVDPGTPWIEKRSASVETLRTHARRKGLYSNGRAYRTLKVYSALTGQPV